MDDFPRDWFTEEERAAGAVVLHIVASLYLFLALALVCDKYFVPAVERICKGKLILSVGLSYLQMPERPRGNPACQHK